MHEANLCVVHDEVKEVGLFQGKDTIKKFCKWLLTKEHQDCIVVAHNFQGYDGYPLQPRDAFYGGRTNAAKLLHECQGDEKIK